MNYPHYYTLLADLVLVLHFLLVSFVIGGFICILIGNRRGWCWIQNRKFRLLHLATVVVIVAQAWLGRLCPLTTLEQSLRVRAGQPAYTETFIQHWLQKALFYEAPLWVFAVIYSLFGIVVLLSWLADRKRHIPDKLDKPD